MIKFKLGQTIYSSHGWSTGRYVFVEIITHETIDGVKVEYVAEEPAGRKVLFSGKEFNEGFFETLKEANELCREKWVVESKRIADDIEAITDDTFDKIAEKMKLAQAKKEGKS